MFASCLWSRLRPACQPSWHASRGAYCLFMAEHVCVMLTCFSRVLFALTVSAGTCASGQTLLQLDTAVNPCTFMRACNYMHNHHAFLHQLLCSQSLLSISLGGSAPYLSLRNLKGCQKQCTDGEASSAPAPLRSRRDAVKRRGVGQRSKALSAAALAARRPQFGFMATDSSARTAGARPCSASCRAPASA